MSYRPFEIEDIVSTINVLVDTREQPTKKYERRVESFGYPFTRKALKFGDYSCEYTDLNENIVDFSKKVSIERKDSFNELCMNFTRERDRFINEFERAKEKNARIHVIVENETWERAFLGKYGQSARFRSKVKPQSLIASILAWQARYDCIFHFCEEEYTGQLIGKILHYELKERLLNEGL